jgi:hypothetical protein
MLTAWVVGTCLFMFFGLLFAIAGYADNERKVVRFCLTGLVLGWAWPLVLPALALYGLWRLVRYAIWGVR